MGGSSGSLGSESGQLVATGDVNVSQGFLGVQDMTQGLRVNLGIGKKKNQRRWLSWGHSNSFPAENQQASPAGSQLVKP